MNRNSKILIIGHNSLAGIALLRRLRADGYSRIFTIPVKELLKQREVERFFKKYKPEYVFFMDIKSGGIIANSTYPAEFIYDNLQAEINAIHFSYRMKIKKLLFMASSCVYPKDSPQPMKEEYILNGSLEPTSEAFAIAKLAGIKMCQYYNRQYGTDFVSVIPATIYGPADNFDLKTSHVIPALMRQIHAAKVSCRPNVTVWGSGRPRREFIHVDDLIDAVIFIMKMSNIPEVINIGSSSDISISELANCLKHLVGFKGKFKFDRAKPDGAFSKLLNSTKLKSIGWESKIDIKDGLEDLYEWYAKYGK